MQPSRMTNLMHVSNAAIIQELKNGNYDEKEKIETLNNSFWCMGRPFFAREEVIKFLIEVEGIKPDYETLCYILALTEDPADNFKRIKYAEKLIKENPKIMVKKNKTTKPLLIGLISSDAFEALIWLMSDTKYLRVKFIDLLNSALTHDRINGDEEFLTHRNGRVYAALGTLVLLARDHFLESDFNEQDIDIRNIDLFRQAKAVVDAFPGSDSLAPTNRNKLTFVSGTFGPRTESSLKAFNNQFNSAFGEKKVIGEVFKFLGLKLSNVYEIIKDEEALNAIKAKAVETAPGANVGILIDSIAKAIVNYFDAKKEEERKLQEEEKSSQWTDSSYLRKPPAAGRSANG